MKTLLLVSLVSLFIPRSLEAKEFLDRTKPLTTNELQLVVKAIYRAEGGEKTKHPYGIIVGSRRFSTVEAKRWCENTVRNNYRRWQGSSETEDFITFLGNRYCPPSVDRVGNKNWIVNVNKLIK